MGRKPKAISKDKPKFTIFTWLKEIQTTKRPWSSFTDEEKEEFNPFMVNKFLSMNRDYIDLVNLVQNIPYTEKEKYYNIYRELIPYGYVYSSFIKGSKESISKEIVSAIALVYTCTKAEAKDYIPLLGKEGIQEILSKVGTEEKVIKKLLKEIE
jgi:hypothetical protein